MCAWNDCISVNRCLWSAWMSSGSVPCGFSWQSFRSKQIWSGWLHTLLSLFVQVCTYNVMCFLFCFFNRCLFKIVQLEVMLNLTDASLFFSKKQEKESLVSVVADLRQATLNTTRFIAETLLLLEVSILSFCKKTSIFWIIWGNISYFVQTRI